MPSFAPAQDLSAALALLRRLNPRPLALALAALPPLAAGLALSGADAQVNLLAQHLMPPLASILWSAPPMILGLAAPLALPLAASLLPRARPLAPRLWAAFLVSLALVSALKAVTGRLHPEAPLPLDHYVRSTAFTLFSGEVMEGWPSGHAATNGAVALALAQGTGGALRALALAWAIWVWAAVTLGISGQVHWLSDMLAGAILALAVALSLPRTEGLKP